MHTRISLLYYIMPECSLHKTELKCKTCKRNKKMYKLLKQQMNECDKTFTYGKYNGKTYKYVCENDPEYCNWLMEQTWFEDDYELSTIILNLDSMKTLKNNYI